MPFALNVMNESRLIKTINWAASISKATDLGDKRIHIKELDAPQQINIFGKRTEHGTCFAGHGLQSIVSLVQSLQENVDIDYFPFCFSHREAEKLMTTSHANHRFTVFGYENIDIVDVSTKNVINILTKRPTNNSQDCIVLPCRAFIIITNITGLLRMNQRNKYILAGQMSILSDHEYAASRVASVFG